MYEKIPKGLTSAGYNLVRDNLRTYKRRANHENVSLVSDMNTFDTSYRFEDEVLTKLLIQKYCSDIERGIVLLYIENPNLSYSEIGRLLGINHHEKVRRLLRSGMEKVRNKLGDDILIRDAIRSG